MEHEPCTLLSDAKPAMQFITANAFLASKQHPRGAKPLFERNRGVLKNRARLQREGGALVLRVALPYAGFGQPRDLLGTTARAFHSTVRPTQLDHKLAAVLEIGEPQNRVPKSRWAFHESSMHHIQRYVKYIIRFFPRL